MTTQTLHRTNTPSLLMRALGREVLPRPPMWLMRQAGRYLPEYRELRADAGDFLNLCYTPALAAEATLQPLRRFALDAAIIFSDILVIPDALGFELYFSKGEGPRFRKPLENLEQLSQWQDSTKLQAVYEAIAQLKPQLSVPLIGFAGAPWTLASYLVSGGSDEGFIPIKQHYYRDPHGCRELLSLLARCVAMHLQAQVRAGADVVMLFDSWAGLLSPLDYFQTGYGAIQQVLDIFYADPQMAKVPNVVFARGVHAEVLNRLSQLPVSALGVDWSFDLPVVAEHFKGICALQGNLDPACLYASASAVKQKTRALCDAMAHFPGFIFNLGHGIMPQTPIENVQALIDAVHEGSHG